MRRVPVFAICAMIGLFALPVPAAAQEDREAYLARMRAICEIGCMQPKQLLSTARRRPANDPRELAAILDIADVDQRGDKYVLLQRTPNLYDMSEFDFGMPQLDQSTISDRNNINVEMDEQTLFDLLNLPQALPPPAPGKAPRGASGDIVVEGDPERETVEPSLAELKALFRNRRIVVRGKPRLDVLFVGARLDRRNKQLTLVLGNADDIALLPRYDSDGQPVLEGPLAGLAGPERGER